MIKGILQEHEEIVKKILKPYVLDYEFFYYGSRVKGTYSPVSDLDILTIPKRVIIGHNHNKYTRR